VRQLRERQEAVDGGSVERRDAEIHRLEAEGRPQPFVGEVAGDLGVHLAVRADVEHGEQVRRREELPQVVEVPADEALEGGRVLDVPAREEAEVVGEAAGLEALELAPHGRQLRRERRVRAVREVDAVVGIAAGEPQVVLHAMSDGRERLLEHLGHE
jgi:hypothetical protein